MAGISNIISAGTTKLIPSIIHAFPCGRGNPVEHGGNEYFEVPEMFTMGIKEPYIIEASGDSMAPKINHGDKLIVDHKIEAQNGDTVVAYMNGDFLIKYYRNTGLNEILYPSNNNYPAIIVSPEDDFRILGVVKWVVSRP